MTAGALSGALPGFCWAHPRLPPGVGMPALAGRRGGGSGSMQMRFDFEKKQQQST